MGDVDWSEKNTGIQPGWTDEEMYINFQPNSPPSGKSLPPTVTTSGSSNITYLTADSSTMIYKMDSFSSIDKTRPMIVTGNCTLWVNDFTVTGSGYVYIAPGASLKLYVGRTASISGGGVINASGLPANFSYFGLPTNETLNYNGTANFVGTINAPKANFTISGGTSVYGAIISNSFTSSGGSGVHYDRALGGGGIFLVTSWREIAR